MVSKYERGNTIKIDVAFKSDGVNTDPSGNKAWFHIIRPDGAYLYSSQLASRVDTGQYRYYISTSASDPLGLYIIQWYAYHNLGGSIGVMPIVQRDVFQIVDTEQD